MVAPMRHHNSPEERAKREAAPEGEQEKSRKGFLHYNHPDEIAKRERAGEPARAVVVPSNPGRVLAATPLPEDPWEGVQLGQPNNEPPRRLGRDVPPLEHKPWEPRSTVGLEPEQRLQQLEAFVYALLDDPGEAREFRLLLSNQAAVTESQRGLISRVRALEQTLEALSSDDDEPGDDEPAVDTLPPSDEPAEGSPVAPELPPPHESE